MPTLSGLGRRGVPPAAIRDFVRRVGAARADNLVEVALLDRCGRGRGRRGALADAPAPPISGR